MEKILRIGTTDDLQISSAAIRIKSLLDEKKVICELIFLKPEPGSLVHNMMTRAILENKIDTYSVDLSTQGIFTYNSSVIPTAIYERTDPGECFILKENILSSDLNSSNNSIKIGIHTMLQKSQIEDIFPGILSTYLNGTEVKKNEVIIPADLDGILISKSMYFQNKEKFISYKYIGLNPKEVIPLPGHGVMACLCHRENINARKVLNLIHQRSLVSVANIERKVLSMAGREYKDRLGVYCISDHLGYFHVYAVVCDPFIKISVSQSISSGLAEKVYQKLLN
ncbi:MAG: hypothetical protein IPL55_09205 [Saprospiraceae bacterium]|nr:hypothetical protein [Saprospiraceae bacterium]MBL0027138.1 hypothetical protein [Saprospiraceae bacterium]